MIMGNRVLKICDTPWYSAKRELGQKPLVMAKEELCWEKEKTIIQETYRAIHSQFNPHTTAKEAKEKAHENSILWQ